jgi:ATP-binding cassette subfamily B protein
VRTRYSGRLHTWQRRQTPTERRAGYFHWVLTTAIHAKEIRLFGLGPLFRRRFREIRAQLRGERLTIARARCLAEVVSQASATAAVYGSYAFIAYRTMQGAITLGDLVMYYQAFQRGQEFLKDMLGGVAGLYEDQLFLSSFYEFLALERQAVRSVSPRPMPRPLRAGIVFDRVTFQYPNGTRKALQDVSLAIRPGEHVAFVGENGSGKTSAVKLLSRLYDPTEGAITLDGIDLRDLDPDALRRDMSVVLQDYALYHLTARENIWLGDIDVSPDAKTIAAAARRSGADEVIARLRRGYDSPLGKWLEDGEELSVGEWQKIALARAFLRRAQIIVLDEPTSALDPRAEYELFRRFRRLVHARTSIIISHRFSTVRLADRIFVFDEGRIVEAGSHDDLVRASGKYAHLFETQAQYYR